MLNEDWHRNSCNKERSLVSCELARNERYKMGSLLQVMKENANIPACYCEKLSSIIKINLLDQDLKHKTAKRNKNSELHPGGRERNKGRII